MTEQTTAAETLGEILRCHVVSISMTPPASVIGCSCGWRGVAHLDHVAEVLSDWLAEQKAQAWDEGFDAGERDVFDHEEHGYNTPCIRNPYRSETEDGGAS